MSCGVCGGPLAAPFDIVRDVPAHSCVLMPTAASARAVPRADLVLAACPRCGFAQNTAFDPDGPRYQPGYEETQACSPTFRRFLSELARQVVRELDLHGRTVVEIGCGKGEFLVALVEAGAGRAIGIDPAADPERIPVAVRDRVAVEVRAFAPGDPLPEAALVACRHTLEHLTDVGDFCRGIARAAPGVPWFLEVPCADRIWREAAFWDVYHEHCSYFSAPSLRRLVQEAGLRCRRLERVYEDQYLVLTAEPGQEPPAAADYLAVVADYGERVRAARAEWSARLRGWNAEGARVVLWGAGSKAVALAALPGALEAVDCCVDINPRKQGCYLPGTGHPVVAPESLRLGEEDVVVVLNPIYEAEIGEQLDALGQRPRLAVLA